MLTCAHSPAWAAVGKTSREERGDVFLLVTKPLGCKPRPAATEAVLGSQRQPCIHIEGELCLHRARSSPVPSNIVREAGIIDTQARS